MKAMFSGTDLEHLYQERFKGRFEYRDKVWTVLVRDVFQKYVRPDDVVLDLGAGYGEFIRHITCAKKYALDLNPDTKNLVPYGIDVLSQDCTAPWPLPDASLDVIFTSNFFEHMPDKQALMRVLAEAYRCLKPGGQIIAMGPNIKHVPGAYWDYWDHHIELTEKSLSEAFMQQGFRIERCIGKFLPFTMASGPHYPMAFVTLYLRLPLAWRLFGRQFLVAARKLV